MNAKKIYEINVKMTNEWINFYFELNFEFLRERIEQKSIFIWSNELFLRMVIILCFVKIKRLLGSRVALRL